MHNLSTFIVKFTGSYCLQCKVIRAESEGDVWAMIAGELGDPWTKVEISSIDDYAPAGEVFSASYID
jgi:hypothetical protein